MSANNETVGNHDVSVLRHQLDTTRLVVTKIFAPTIAAFGLVGNALTIVILTRKSMKSSTNVYLSALAVYDLLYLLFAVTMTLIHYEVISQSPWYVHYQKPVGRPLADTASNTAVLLTLTFTIERYINIRFPIQGKVTCDHLHGNYCSKTMDRSFNN